LTIETEKETEIGIEEETEIATDPEIQEGIVGTVTEMTGMAVKEVVADLIIQTHLIKEHMMMDVEAITENHTTEKQATISVGSTMATTTKIRAKVMTKETTIITMTHMAVGTILTIQPLG